MPRSNLPLMVTPELREKLEELTQAIETDPENADAWYQRGDFYLTLGLNNKNFLEFSISDFSRAIHLNGNNSKHLLFRGGAYHLLGENNLALKDFNSAIDIGGKEFLADLYFFVGASEKNLGNLEKAECAFLKSIEIEECNVVHKYLGLIYIEKREWVLAEKEFLININDENKRYLQQIKRQKNNPDVFDAVEALQKHLEFDGDKLTHYTSLDVGQAMLIEQSKFRLGHIGGVNDPNEGKLLWQQFGLDHTEDSNPVFIACFLPESDSLNMWRFYGKNHGVDAAGCAITYQGSIFDTAKIAKEQHKNEPSTEEKNKETKEFDAIIKENQRKLQQSQLKFYKVLYVKPNESGDGFIIDNLEIKGIFDSLIAAINKFQKTSEDSGESKEIYQKKLAELLAPLRYLIKHHDYHAERECRIIVSHLDYGDGEIRALAGNSKEGIPPRLYLELEWDDHLAPIKQVTLGPKSPFADQQRAYWRNELKKRFNKELSINRSNCSFQ